MPISISKFRTVLAERFNLSSDQSSFEEIDKNIRDGIEIRGTNLWVLMLAIFIASIGLDVNSTAVIIGAMLISPLMGPIMGVGYGAGINDYLLIRKALGNLLVSILIALLTSTVYFLLSPLSTAQSELLARTSPTIWDVLIALFGGLAGIIAITRKEKSNVIPGVAIATALMPPLCTASYGIANGSMQMFLGAFYLFFINCVFIALAALLLVSYIDPPHKRFVDEQLERKVKRYIYIVVLGTVLPSIYLAYGLVTREVFVSRANDFIKHEIVFDNVVVAKQSISADMHEIDLTLIGKKVDEKELARLSGKLGRYRIENAKLIVHQSLDKEYDETSLTKSLLSGIFNSSQEALDAKNKQIQELQNTISDLRAQRDSQIGKPNERQKIFSELAAQYPQVKKLSIAKTDELQTGGSAKNTVLFINITADKPLPQEDRHKIAAWLKIRAAADEVKLTVENE